MAKGPAIHPNWAVLHANDRTPAPMTPVMIWAMHVHIVPGRKDGVYRRLQNQAVLFY